MATTTMTRLATAPAYAVLPAEDLERAKAFYHDTLGLEVEGQGPASDQEFVVHTGEGTRFLVYQRARTVAEHTVMAFLVQDLRAVMEELRSRGVRFEEYDLPGIKTVNGVMEYGDGLSAWFTDTEGNIINIMQPR